MASTYKTQRTKLREICFPLSVQTLPAENMADADFVRAELMETSNFGQIKQTWESDYDYAGKRTSFATEAHVIEIDSTLDYQSRANNWNLGYLLAMVMGVDTFTPGAVGPPATPNSHVLTWLDTSDPAWLTNVWIKDTQGLQRRFLDMAVDTLTITGNAKGSIIVKASFKGSGRYADGALLAKPALDPAPVYLNGFDSTVSIGPAGGNLASFFPRAMSWELEFKRNVSVERRPGNGLYAAFLANGDPTMTLKLVVGVDDTSDIRDWSIGQTPLQVQIVCPFGPAGSGQSCTFVLPRVVLPDSDLSESEKYVAYTVNLDENSILKPAAGEAITVTVLNGTTQYLQSVPA